MTGGRLLTPRRFLVVVAAIGIARPSLAASHLWRVNELFSNASGTIQFIELHECCGSSSEVVISGKNVFSQVNGSVYNFTEDLTQNTAFKYLLLATPAFAALPGAPTPDYIIPPNFFAMNQDTVGYFPYDTFTFPAGALPLDGINSVQLTSYTPDAFATGTNSPTNFAGQTGSVNAGCIDNDGDEYGAGPGCAGADCDDNDPATHPGVPETCGDGIDNDCNNLTDCAEAACVIDADGDTFAAPSCGLDCNDSDPAVNPGAAEACADVLDNDCDGCPDAADADCGGVEGGCATVGDTDCDGVAGCADSDCAGETACTCFIAATPSMEMMPNAGQTMVMSKKSRYLSFSAGDAGRSQAVVVTFVSLPGAYSGWNGARLWVGDPSDVCEAGGVGPGQPCAGATSKFAGLRCTPTFRDDWSTMGAIHVHHEGVIPGARYHVQVADAACGAALDPATWPQPLVLETTGWGDLCGPYVSGLWTAPDGTRAITADVIADLDKFANRPGAPIKARADIDPRCQNMRIDITDVTRLIEGFRGLAYPFVPSNPDPCQSICG